MDGLITFVSKNYVIVKTVSLVLCAGNCVSQILIGIFYLRTEKCLWFCLFMLFLILSAYCCRSPIIGGVWLKPIKMMDGWAVWCLKELLQWSWWLISNNHSQYLLCDSSHRRIFFQHQCHSARMLKLLSRSGRICKRNRVNVLGHGLYCWNWKREKISWYVAKLWREWKGQGNMTEWSQNYQGD